MVKKDGSGKNQKSSKIQGMGSVRSGTKAPGEDGAGGSGGFGGAGPASINLSAIMSLSALAPQFKNVAVLAEALSEAVQEECEVFDDMFSDEEVEDITLDAKEIQIIASRIGDDILERLNESIETAITATENNAAEEAYDKNIVSEGLNVIDENMLTPAQLDKLLDGELSVDDLTDEQKEDFLVDNNNDLVSQQFSSQLQEREGLLNELLQLPQEEWSKAVSSLHEVLVENKGPFAAEISDEDSEVPEEYEVLYDITNIRDNTFPSYQDLVKNADKDLGKAWTEKGKGYVHNGSRWVRDDTADF